MLQIIRFGPLFRMVLVLSLESDLARVWDQGTGYRVQGSRFSVQCTGFPPVSARFRRFPRVCSETNPGRPEPKGVPNHLIWHTFENGFGAQFGIRFGKGLGSGYRIQGSGFKEQGTR